MDDYELALQIEFGQDHQDVGASFPNHQNQNDENNHGNTTNAAMSPMTSVPLSLVDPQWEIIDPIPDLRTLFIEFNAKYFWGELEGVEVKWSNRMTVCAGLCVYEGHGGLCSVRLSEPLLKLRPRKDFIETLLHEMIHAYLFVTANNKDHDGHGPEFHKHMYRLNKETGTNISVYHNFHDEVANYRQHWWRCDGPCRTRSPYFGYVKRSMNRAPSAQDNWWPRHVQSCGGSYTKVKEPEGYGEKKTKKVTKENSEKTGKPPAGKKTASGSADIRSLFGSNNDNKSSTATGNTKLGNNGIKNSTGNRNSTVVVTKKDDKENNIPASRENDQLKTDRNVMGAQTIWSLGETDQKLTNAHSSAFQGRGNHLGGNTRHPKNAPIVRKLPGFGVITTERHEHKNDRPRIIGRSTVDKHKDGGEKRKKAGYVADSSDEEFDKTLNQLSADRKKVKLSGGKIVVENREQLTRNSPIGSTIKVKNFRSVSNKKSSTKKGRSRSGSLGGSFIAKPGTSTEKPGPSNISRIKSSGTDLAAGRNLRMLLKDSDDDDCSTDDDERVPLGVVRGDLMKETGGYKQDKDSEHNDILDSSYSLSGSESVSSDDDDELLLPSTSKTKGKRIKVQHDDSFIVDDDESDDNDAASGGDADPMQQCPICDANVVSSQINNHLDGCAEIENSQISEQTSQVVLDESNDEDDDDEDIISVTDQVIRLGNGTDKVPEPGRRPQPTEAASTSGAQIIDVTENHRGATAPEVAAVNPVRNVQRTPDNVITIPDNNGENNHVNCPVCQRLISANEINTHLDQCMIEVDNEPEAEQAPAVDPNVSVCPVCQAKVPAEQINIHLDQCLS